MAEAGTNAGYLGAIYINKRWCLVCDTESDLITVPNPADGHLDFTATDAFSVEMWVNCQSAGDQIFIRKGTKAAGAAGYALLVDGANKAVFYTCDASANATTVAATSSDIGNDSLWHHIVGVRNYAGVSTDNLIIYVDGVDCGSVSDTTADTLVIASDLLIGPSSDAGASAWDNVIGMARIWKTALTAAQVSDLENGDFPAAVADNLVGEWLFEEGTGTKAWDSSSYKSTGTVSVSCDWSNATYDTETDDAVGTGDAADTTWQLSPGGGERDDLLNIDKDNLTVVLSDGAAVTSQYLGTHFSMTPRGLLTFKTAPPAGDKIKATYRYYRMTLEVGGFHAWTVDWTADAIDVTDFRTAGPRYFIGGRTGWTGSAERHWVSPTPGMDFATDNEYIVRLYTNEDDNRYFHGWARINGISTTADPGSVLEESITLQGTNVLSQETTL